MPRKPDYRILYVDDEAKSLRYFKKVFSEDFNLLVAESAAEALEILESDDANIGILIADQRMPKVKGIELIQEVRERWPEIVSLLVTAYMDLDVALEAINRGRVFQYVCKPWCTDSLKIVLLEASQEFERKRHFSALEEKNRQLQEAHRAQDRFIYTLSHEVRTPIGLSLNNADQLLATSLDEEQRDFVNSIKVVNQSLLSVLDNTLDYSMWEAGKLILIERQFRLSELLERIEKSFELQFKAANVRFLMKSEFVVHDCIVGDPDRLLQVLLNLLSNAIKYSPAGKEVTLAISVLEENRREVGLRFSVTDRGDGIAAAIQDRLFKPFSQLQTAKEGSGLGLLISKELIALMGGEIGVNSELGKGSEFWFEVKFGRCADPSGPAKPIERKRSQSGIPVLLADDSPVGQAVVDGLLSNQGYVVEIAENGIEAMALAKARRYAVIILDCQMPEMNGMDATRGIRKEGLNKETPIIGLSAMPASVLEKRWIDEGIDEYVTKPLESQLFLDTVSRLVEQGGDSE